MKHKVLITAPYFQPVLDRFGDFFAERQIEVAAPSVRERLSEAELFAWMGDVDGVICGDDSFTDEVLRRSPKLKVISKWGTGIDSIDREACSRRGVSVYNTPGAFTDPVADTVMGYVLTFARGLHRLAAAMKGGSWEKVPGRALGECTLGVIGVGNIGKAVARRAAVFGMRILGNDPLPMPADFLAETPVEMVSKEVLLRHSDFVSLNCDLNPTSYHLLGEPELRLLQPTTVVVNTSRGRVIDEAALIDALKEGRLAGAGLDVFEEEPLPADSPLRSMDNVLLAPHSANGSPTAWERVHWNTVRNLLKGLGEECP